MEGRAGCYILFISLPLHTRHHCESIAYSTYSRVYNFWLAKMTRALHIDTQLLSGIVSAQFLDDIYTILGSYF